MTIFVIDALDVFLAERQQQAERLEAVKGNVYLWQIGELDAVAALQAIIADDAALAVVRDINTSLKFPSNTKIVNDAIHVAELGYLVTIKSPTKFTAVREYRNEE